MAHRVKSKEHKAEGRGQKVKGTLHSSGIVKGIPPRLNKKAKTFNWAGGVNPPD